MDAKRFHLATTFSRETIIAADVTGENTVTRILFIVKINRESRKESDVLCETTIVRDAGPGAKECFNWK